MLIVSSMLNSNIIKNDNFTDAECLRLLIHSNNITIQMEFADLKYILFNNFDILKKKYFFKHQEVLDGRSICQISLSDPQSVEEATKTFSNPSFDDNNLVEHFENLIEGDSFRRIELKNSFIYPKV